MTSDKRKIDVQQFSLPKLHTKRYENLMVSDVDCYEKIIFEKNSAEERGHLPIWRELQTNSPEKLITIELQNTESIESDKITVEQHGVQPQEISLRDESQLSKLVSSDNLLIDITSLPHHVWAPLLKACHSMNKCPKVLYVEPEEYKPHPSPATAFSFDLTESYRGLSPLPGFAQLYGPEDESKCLFIALLGFEGNRPQHLVMNIDPPPKIVPIVGVPGFKVEMPQVTIACNSRLLNENNVHSNLRYSRASCPFELYETLIELSEDYQGYYFYIAPTGTKPHALGAIWYAINHKETTELMYDHPVRKSGRTRGVGTIHIYDLGYIHGA